ncbi:hypothetical protein HYH02_001034 [Chlamydomonas schloesseri]|uniref:Citrate transporter-like domain-containing protein n=1 Tax=Chlamydomonas schloesseri TaxID=2026947 RepID=A0A835WX57_9CHLO|nr:hypothetical protein HYH02_001034 [Chlamydomonas schloesseri]|eukprot:KAG2453990.1 hypothetical protein HYH02_001034 [Chlamydomonas schloesseri]
MPISTCAGVGTADTRRFLGAAVVVAANAGGAWTPIGDVTTTMLWIHGQVSTAATMRDLLLPSALSVAVPVAAWALTAPEIASKEPLLLASSSSASSSPPAASSGRDAATASHAATAAAAAAQAAGPGSGGSAASPGSRGQEVEAGAGAGAGAGAEAEAEAAPPRSNLVLSVGLGSLLMVPVLRAWAGLPPHMGMLACLGFLWLVTDAIHFGEGDRRHLTVSQALKRVDSEAVLFFTGVLLAVAALDKAGLLRELAEALSAALPRQELVAGVIGFASAVVDNVPLVAATMGMYDMAQYPKDSDLWQLIAYCAGTGGSLLVIGSAAGVTLMGMDRGVSFGWYARRITPWATAGYLAGLGAYVAQQQLQLQLAGGGGGAAAAVAAATATGLL